MNTEQFIGMMVELMQSAGTIGLLGVGVYFLWKLLTLASILFVIKYFCQRLFDFLLDKKRTVIKIFEMDDYQMDLRGVSIEDIDRLLGAVVNLNLERDYNNSMSSSSNYRINKAIEIIKQYADSKGKEETS